MKPLTQRQQQVFDYIQSYAEETGMPPTRAEIARSLGFRSANAAEDHCKALAKKGYIEMLSGVSRGLRVLIDDNKPASSEVQNQHASVGLPIVGKVAAGQPILSEELGDNCTHIQAELFQPSADYLLRVEGLSMKDIGINEGDLLAVKQANHAKEGEVIVARVDGEVTVKRLKKVGSNFQLISENPDYEPIDIREGVNQFEIEGVAVGVVRQRL